MQYNIHINQIKAIEWDLNEKEALIIDTITRLPTWAKWKEINWEIYYYLSAWLLVKELPFISNSKWSFLNLIKKLKEKWLLEYKRIWNESYYNLTTKIKEWYSSPTDWWSEVSLDSDEGLTDWWDNNIYNNNILEKTNKKENSTDLSFTSTDEIIEWRNSLPSQFHFPKWTSTNRNLKIFNDLNIQWLKTRREYDKDTFNAWMDNYIKDIEARNPNQDYSKHRFTLFQWIKQSNALAKFAAYG